MRKFNKVAIIGTGLIGGSMALVIKKRHLAREVVGVSRHKKSLFLAKSKGAIDAGSQKLEIIRGADLVVLATPVSNILEVAPKISALLKKGCIVIDVGSTKEKIVSRLGKIFPNFVGTHPLAGSEKRSIANADAGIFKGSLCILTPDRHTNKNALKRVKALWQEIGAKTVQLSPQKHDEVLSFVSHLPHIAAFTLMSLVPVKFLKFASGGLKDTTRIAASDSGIWADIFLSNSKELVEKIGLLISRLTIIKSSIQRRDRLQIQRILEEAKNKRVKIA